MGSIEVLGGLYMKPDMKTDRDEIEKSRIALLSSLFESLHVSKWYEIHIAVDFTSLFLTDVKFQKKQPVFSTGLHMKTWKFIKTYFSDFFSLARAMWKWKYFHIC